LEDVFLSHGKMLAFESFGFGRAALLKGLRILWSAVNSIF
jgi:hypothetical protein